MTTPKPQAPNHSCSILSLCTLPLALCLLIFLSASTSFAEPSGKCSQNMVSIPAGVFVAGNKEWEWTLKERPINAFCMDKYEVTQAEYEREMGDNPSKFKGPNRPVEKVNWHQAKDYCRKVGKRLPTEWEWEKAAKAGTTTGYYWGNDVGHNNANCVGCGSRWDDKETAPVGSFRPNPWGLYDMAGNVWEWTVSDHEGNKKVSRGGSWRDGAGLMRTAARWGYGASTQLSINGFRCVQ